MVKISNRRLDLPVAQEGFLFNVLMAGRIGKAQVSTVIYMLHLIHQINLKGVKL